MLQQLRAAMDAFPFLLVAGISEVDADAVAAGATILAARSSADRTLANGVAEASSWSFFT